RRHTRSSRDWSSDVCSSDLSPARWVVDPDFNLDYHVRRVRVPEPGTLRQVFDLAEVDMQSPLDISRPLWTATLVEGLRDGRAAKLGRAACREGVDESAVGLH